jgi:dTDP-4-dehydrorhamnose reductase
MLFDAERPPGYWHVANDGICSWHRLAEDVYRKAKELDMLDHDVNIIPVTTAEYMELVPEQAERPPFSVLETKRVEKHLNRPMKHYRASLAECILNIKEMEEQ